MRPSAGEGTITVSFQTPLTKREPMSTFRRIDSLLDGKTSDQLAHEVTARARKRAQEDHRSTHPPVSDPGYPRPPAERTAVGPLQQRSGAFASTAGAPGEVSGPIGLAVSKTVTGALLHAAAATRAARGWRG